MFPSLGCGHQGWCVASPASSLRGAPLTHGTATRPGAGASLAAPPPDAGAELEKVGGLSDLGENQSFGTLCRAHGPGGLGGGLSETLRCWQPP